LLVRVMPPVGTTVWIERRKWEDHPHYGSEAVVLGQDEHGIWLGAGPANRMYKGMGDMVSGRHHVVWCVPREGWFMAHFLRGHPELDIYIDIAAPAVWSERGPKLVDLDFDIVVWNDGRPVELVDEDEFEMHRVQLEYPAALVDGARAAAVEVLERARAAAAPFDVRTADPWFQTLELLR
jgi:uncharacterized protein